MKLSSEQRAKVLLSKMTLNEKVGQVNQKLFGFNVYSRENCNGKDEIQLTETLINEVNKFSGLGVLYGLYRADPWSGKDFETGVEGVLATKVYNQVQKYVIEHSRLGIPMLLSTECPHGHQALGGYLLPVNLAMGATFNTQLIHEAYHVCGKQMKTMGVDFALISMLDILRDPRWGRSEECFAEDPYLASEMAKAVVSAVQSEKVAVVAKHFCAQGEGSGGVNASAARIGEREVREIHLPVMQACSSVGVAGVMAAYNEIDGVFCHSNSRLLKGILRDEIGFKGVIMADGTAIDRLDSMTGNNELSAHIALKAGIDISLWDEGFSKLEKVVRNNVGLLEELDRAVLKVLTLKYERGLFEQPYIEETAKHLKYNYTNYDESLRIARESVVLLENKNEILPLSFDKYRNIAVIGPNADAIYSQLGDYAPYIKENEGVTVLRGIENIVNAHNQQENRNASVRYEKGSELMDSSSEKLEKAIELGKDSDVIVLVLGGSSSRFGQVSFDLNGAVATKEKPEMDCGEGVDVSSLELPVAQVELAQALMEIGKPIILVLIQGRPYSIGSLVEGAEGVLASFYPGPMGGRAIAEIVFGITVPSGCLPVSVPVHAGQLPVYYNYKSSYNAMDYSDGFKKPLYVFGYGKSYTRFEFMNFSVNWNKEARLDDDKQTVEDGKILAFDKEILKKHSIEITFTVRNSGKFNAYVVPQLYIHQEYSTTVRRVKELKAFDKVYLEVGESKVCTLGLDWHKLLVWNEECYYDVEASKFQLIVQDGTEVRWKNYIDVIESISEKENMHVYITNT